jgi:ABC-2 type transport system ATP-binding protein
VPGLRAPADAALPAIRAQGLRREFGDLVAVDGLNLEVPSRTIFGFLGPNGAGKTTTIRLLLGLVEPTAGTAQVAGIDVAEHPAEARRRVGVLLEYPGLYERLSAQDNLEFHARLWHMPPTARRSRIDHLLDHFGLSARRNDVVGSWSRGMRQKLGLARAMLHEPEVLFLDEPTAGLDPVAAVGLRDDLERLADDEGTTVFLTTHNLDEADRLCKGIAVIDRGRLLAVGDPQQLRARQGRPGIVVTGRGLDDQVQARLRARPEVTAVQGSDQRLVIELAEASPSAPLVRVLVDAGADVEEVHKTTPTLEEAFLRLLAAEPG